ncbi:hypothetical protein H5410_036192 [Solanum commersonii]|uniref:Uncharacterized protein n=1 Tax=Solanum commersonii TaxID=4109 RepID=A0A9J5Y5S5_SOLCO|nr:hypothetical protein H5410_036192 [Solanum commersonii]
MGPNIRDKADLGSLGEEGEVSETSQLDEKIIEVKAGLSALNRRLVVYENNFSSLETVALEGLDKVKNNLEELKEFETLKRQVDEIAGAGVASPITIRETCIEAPKAKEFRVKGRDNWSKNVPPKGDNNQNKSKPIPNRGSDTEQKQAAAQIGGPPGEQGGQAGRADRGKNVDVGMFNHMTLAALAAQPASVRPRESLFVNAKLNGKDVRIMVDTGVWHRGHRQIRWGACTAPQGAPQGATLNFSSFKGEAYSCCTSASLKRRVKYFPAFGDDLENLDKHVAALTFSENRPQQRGQG